MDRYSYTTEELFVSIAINLLLDDSLITRHKTFKYLKNLPADFILDSQLKTILKVLIEACGKGNGELQSADALYQKIVSRIADIAVDEKKINVSYFVNLYALAPIAGMLISIPLLHELAVELLNKWKKRKRAFYQKVLATSKNLTDEQLAKIIKELMEIENYSPFPDMQEDIEEDMFLSMADAPEDFDVEVEYLYENFLPKNTINLWVAPASQGKSALALFLACYLLDQNKVDKVIYLDGDNQRTVLAQRGLKEIRQKYKDRLFYYSKDMYSKKMQEYLLKTEKVKGRVLIVIDTLRALVGPKNINKGEEAEKIMAIFRDIVNSGDKTIIVLHHVNKPPLNENGYTLADRIKGATEFRDRCDIAYFFTKKDQDENSIYITLENVKPRLPVRQKIHFKVDIKNKCIEELEEILTKEEKIFVSAVLKVIDEVSQMTMQYPNKYQIEQRLREHGFGRNQIRAWLDKFNGKFWRQNYDGLRNQIILRPIRKENNIPRRTGELRNNADFMGKGNGINRWQTGELRNNADLEELTPEQEKAIREWGGREEKNIPRRTGELRNNQSSPVVEGKNTPRQSGELRNNASSPVRHPKNLKKSSEMLMNSKFASSPPNTTKPPEKSSKQLSEKYPEEEIDINSLPPEVLSVCFPTKEDREKLPLHLKRKVESYIKEYNQFVIKTLSEDEEEAINMPPPASLSGNQLKLDKNDSKT